jgi:hypothetical protein
MAVLILPGTAALGDVLTGKKFSAGANYGATGTMPERGSPTFTPGPSAQAIAEGHYSGGSVAGVAVDASKVLVGTTIAGTPGAMPNNGAPTWNPVNYAQNLAAGYYSGGTVSAVTFDPNYLLSGYTIANTAGAMPNHGGVANTPTSQSAPGDGNLWLHIPYGYYNADSSVQVYDANFVPNNIIGTIFGLAGTAQRRQYASGTATSSGTTGSFGGGGYNTTWNSIAPLTVTGLSFQPRMIWYIDQANKKNFVVYSADGVVPYGGYHCMMVYQETPASSFGPKVWYVSVPYGDAVINSNGFVLPAYLYSTPFNWYAFG